MKRFSVVIPTMWRSKRTKYLLDHLCEVDSVGQVIIIDNDTSKTPQLPESKKIKYLPQEKNIYVNPAWNLGIKESSEDNVCILNDDVSCDWDELFDFMSSLKEDKYCIGVHPVSYKYKESGIMLHDSVQIGRGWGTCIFISKTHWVDIPDSMKIFCGDLFISDTYGCAKSFMGYIETEMSTTSSDESFQSILDSDVKAYGEQRID